jgi:hypothetical protein
MAFLHGSNAKVLVGGYDITGYLTDFSPTLNGEAVDVTTLSATWHDVIAGLKSFSATGNGFYDPTQDTIILATVNAVKQWMYYPQGDTLGRFGYGMQSVQTSYAPTSPIGGASAFTVSATGKGAADRIVSLHALSAATADTDGASVDNSASSANGGGGYLQVTAFSGFSGAVIKIQHSTDDAVWADLITFTTVASGPTTEVMTVTGTVNRYLRYQIDITGSGSITFAVGFGRR